LGCYGRLEESLQDNGSAHPFHSHEITESPENCLLFPSLPFLFFSLFFSSSFFFLEIDFKYEATQIGVFAKMVEAGLSTNITFSFSFSFSSLLILSLWFRSDL
jgi:hypothetical protein